MLMRAESIHLWKQLVNGWIFLWTSPIIEHSKTFSISNSIDLININNCRRWLFSFFEKIFHSFWTDSHINLTKLWSVARKKRHSSLSRSCFCQSGLTSTRRTIKNNSSSHSSPDRFINFGVFHVIYNFLKRLFAFFKTYNILKGNSFEGLRTCIDLTLAVSLHEHVKKESENRPK